MSTEIKNDVFISYSRKDYVDEATKQVIPGNIVSQIKEMLDANGISYWFDEEGIYSGDAFAPLIAKNIKSAKIFLFISSENSNASEWTSNEIATAHAYKKKIIPFRYDDSIYNDSVIIYIAKLDYIEYKSNPSKALSRLLSSIQVYLKSEKEREEKEKESEERRLNEEKSKQEKADKLQQIREQIENLETRKFQIEQEIFEQEKSLSGLRNEKIIVEDKIFDLRCERDIIYDVNQQRSSIFLSKQPNEEKQEESTSKRLPETKTYTVNGVSFDMVAVRGGTFTMGATLEQGSDVYDRERPIHQVTLSDYMIGKTEVTQELWQAVMGSNPSRFKGDQLPVERVSWNDCQEFIKKLNSLTGLKFRLPTEAEWEYAARGGNKSKDYKYSGSNDIGSVAWYYVNSGDTILDERNRDDDNLNNCRTHEVMKKTPNELGLYDMSGNVWEWCIDCYDYYSSRSQTNPKGPKKGSDRVLRGGSWINGSRSCRVSFRLNFTPGYSDSKLGLRLAL